MKKERPFIGIVYRQKTIIDANLYYIKDVMVQKKTYNQKGLQRFATLFELDKKSHLWMYFFPSWITIPLSDSFAFVPCKL